MVARITGGLAYANVELNSPILQSKKEQKIHSKLTSNGTTRRPYGCPRKGTVLVCIEAEQRLLHGKRVLHSIDAEISILISVCRLLECGLHYATCIACGCASPHPSGSRDARATDSR
jgi:hypothetical protein